MNWRLERMECRADGIFGVVVSEEADLTLFSLERSFKNKDETYSPVIPAGTYTCIRRHSPKLGYELFMLTNVPGHDFIEIHIGNKNGDSTGCILIGLARTSTCILDSRKAFDRFMALETGTDSFQLNIY